MTARHRSSGQRTGRHRSPYVPNPRVPIRACRHDPRRTPIIRIRCDGKTEMHTRSGHADFLPAAGRVVTVENTAVVLLPEMIRLPGAAGHEVRVVAPVRCRVRKIVHQHAAITSRPGSSAIGGLDDTGGRYRDMDMIRIARIDQDGMNAGFEHAVIDARRRAMPTVFRRRIAGPSSHRRRINRLRDSRGSTAVG